MIKNKLDLYQYLKQDSRNFEGYYKYPLKNQINLLLNRNPITDQYAVWRYIKYLRLCEYAININCRCLKYFYLYRLRKYSYKTGIQIPPNVCGPGLTIWHWGTIIINQAARIGKNCTIHANVQIGKKTKEGKAPTIGDNCYICFGSIILGDIKIGDNVIILHNTVVRKDVPSNCTVAGNPASIIKMNGEHVNIPL